MVLPASFSNAYSLVRCHGTFVTPDGVLMLAGQREGRSGHDHAAPRLTVAANSHRFPLKLRETSKN